MDADTVLSGLASNMPVHGAVGEPTLPDLDTSCGRVYTLVMREPSAPSGATRLVRVLGVRVLAANVVNQIVGAGIFALPATIAAILGPSAAVAYLVCAAAIGLVALCFAEVGSRVVVTGGVYRYVEAAFGPYLGFVAGAFLLLGQVTGSAAIATIGVDSLGALVPAAGAPALRWVIVIVLYTALTAVNIRGVRAGARTTVALTAMKIAPLVLLVAAGLFVLRPAYLAGLRLPSLEDLGRASVLLFFAFGGERPR